MAPPYCLFFLRLFSSLAGREGAGVELLKQSCACNVKVFAQKLDDGAKGGGGGGKPSKETRSADVVLSGPADCVRVAREAIAIMTARPGCAGGWTGTSPTGPRWWRRTWRTQP